MCSFAKQKENIVGCKNEWLFYRPSEQPNIGLWNVCMNERAMEEKILSVYYILNEEKNRLNNGSQTVWKINKFSQLTIVDPLQPIE